MKGNESVFSIVLPITAYENVAVAAHDSLYLDCFPFQSIYPPCCPGWFYVYDFENKTTFLTFITDAETLKSKKYRFNRTPTVSEIIRFIERLKNTLGENLFGIDVELRYTQPWERIISASVVSDFGKPTDYDILFSNQSPTVADTLMKVTKDIFTRFLKKENLPLNLKGYELAWEKLGYSFHSKQDAKICKIKGLVQELYELVTGL